MKTGSARRTRSYFAHLLGGIAITALIILPAGAASAADGELLWATNAGGTSEDSGRGISTLSDGSSVVTGYFSGTAVFGAGESNETTLVAAGSSDIFIARYNADGTLARAKRAGGTDEDYGTGISTFLDGSSVVTGFFSDTATFGANELNTTTLVSAGSQGMFIARYNDDETLVWAKSAGGTISVQGLGISTFLDGSSVITGVFHGTAVFGAGESNKTTLVSAEVDIFVARYNADGTLAWAKRAGGGSLDLGTGISTFSDGSSIMTGSFLGNAIFGPGEPNATTLVSAGVDDICIARYNADGTLAWAKRAGGTQEDLGGGISAFSDGSSVVTGGFGGTATFGPGEPNTTTLVSAGSQDMFIARYNANGTLAWAKSAAGTGTDYGSGISTFSDGSSIMTGYFTDTAVFGVGEASETTLVAAGGYDICIARYNADGTLAWARRAGGTQRDDGWGISFFPDGSSVVTGSIEGTATFGPGELNETELISAGWDDIFVAKYAGPPTPTPTPRGDPNADGDTHDHPDLHAHGDAHHHAHAHGDPDPHGDLDGDAHHHAHAHRDADRNAHGDPDAHRDADRNAHGDHDAHRDADRNAHGDSDTYGDANGDAHGDPDGDARRHAHAHGDPVRGASARRTDAGGGRRERISRGRP